MAVVAAFLDGEAGRLARLRDLYNLVLNLVPGQGELTWEPVVRAYR
jgi:hypothetical protein